MNARAEALLFMASRAELIAEVVKPALERGELVLADRFFLSTYAYQVVGRGLPFEDVRAANKLATAGLVPDITILLTLPTAIRDARVVARGGADRIETAGHWFHELVERAFSDCAAPAWQASHPECGPIATVDGTGTEKEVLERVLGVLSRQIPDVFQMQNAAHA
jgi:dTMP kinase